MILEKVRIQNFKSIQDSDFVDIHSFLNIITGINNAGKSAFIEAIYLCFSGHLNYQGISGGNNGTDGIRNLATSPAIFEFILQINHEEQKKFEDIFKSTFASRKIKISFLGFEGISYFNDLSVFDAVTPVNINPMYFKDNDNHFRVNIGGNLSTVDDKIKNLLESIFNELKAKIYYISGERRVPTHQSIMSIPRLDATATQLHTHMMFLLTNKQKTYNRIVESFVAIFPEVENLSPEMIGINTQVTNIQIKFKDLTETIPIQKCGSGFYHVLILIILLNSESNGLIILFDEPNSFLHPSAEKAVYDTISTQTGHQYIFTTHSPILINYPAEKNIILIKKQQGCSIFNKLEQVGPALDEIGIRNSDFAFANKIIFVEGKTERELLPKILAAFGRKQIGYNYSVIELRGTGDEWRRKQYMIANASVFQDLMKTISSNPIPYVFLLDRDERNYQEISEKYGKDHIILLGKREFENYLLNAEAIHEMLKQVFNLEVNVNELNELIQDCLKNPYLFPSGILQTGNPINDIRGSEVLDAIIKKYINYDYAKPSHGSILVNWILSNHPIQLKEISDLLEPFLNE
ncbi:MAG: hypothetical protein JWM44_2476 [Bacilli bacterium]|nr:hypothetical protein [Bacilli bacterium]